MRETDQDLLVLKEGTVLQDRYVIEEQIGRGGFGITYRARDMRVDVPVAVKEYLPWHQLNRKDAERETRMAARFYGLEGIAAARDFFTEGDHSYIVMEYVSGMSVRQYIRENGRMSGGEALQKIRPIIRTLGRIHKEGVIHRDISANNLMITDTGDLKLIDFGTARFSGEYRRNSHTLIFNHGFAPVEQCRTKGKQGPWTDVYALCATIYFMITGLVPDDSVDRMIDDRMKSLRQIQGTGLDSHQAMCIMKGLEVHPEDRYQNMASLYEDLYGGQRQVEAETGEERKSHSFTTNFHTTTFLRELKEIGRGRKRNGIIVITGTALLAAAVLLFVIVLQRDAGRSAPVPSSSSLGEKPAVSASGAAAILQTDETGGSAQTSPPSGEAEDEQYMIEDYTGLTRKQAKNKTAAFRDAGLKLKYETRYSKKAKGMVISQTLKAGTTYRDFKGVSLVLVVSKGKKPSPTPAPTQAPREDPFPTAAPARISREAPSAKPKEKKKPEVDFSGNLDTMLGG